MIGFRFPLAAGLALGLAALAAPGVQAAEPDGPQQLIRRMDAVYITVLDRLSTKGKKSLGLDKAGEKGLADYYSDRGNTLVWVTDSGLNDRVKMLRTVIGRAGEWGLNAGDYAPADGKGFSSNSGYPATWLAEAELKTAIAAVTYARHAQTGRFEPSSVNENLDKHPEHPDPAAVLKGILAAGERVPAYLEGFNPQNEQFKALKRMLAEGGSRPAEPQGNVVSLPDGPSLGPGTSHPHIAILHERLSVQPMRNAPGDGPAEEYYDERLADAVRAFQKRRGLAARGIVNAATREALNAGAGSSGGSTATATTGAGKIDTATIIANMERWRWEARDLGTRHIRVNIPEFIFYVMDRGKVIHTERIVSGAKEHPTPIFTDEMETVIFNPYWNVPESILVKELLPAIRRDPGFLDRNKLEVVWQGRKPVVDTFWGGGGGIDWEYVDQRKVALRQTPGAGNALGVVKFAFPNKHSVYMHDTPTKHLFEKQVRAYSHGCMRVRNPLKFAEVLLADQGWNAGKINATLEVAHDQQVQLHRKVPIHIMYFTLWVGDDGRVQRYGDIYGHDLRVKVALRLEKAPKVSADDRMDAGERGLGN